MKSKEFEICIRIKAMVIPEAEKEYSPTEVELQEAIVKFFALHSITNPEINSICLDFDNKHMQIKPAKG